MAAQLRLKLDRDPRYRREDYIASESAEPALRLLDAWPSWPGGTLALIGPPGSGKTHLATAWADRARAAQLAAPAPLIPGELARLEGRPVLVENADHLQDPAWDETLFHLINMAARPGGSLLLTARTLPSTWPARLPDLRSRLNALPVALLGPPDDAVLSALLKRFFHARNIRPSDDLLPYLVRRIVRSAAKAQEIVQRLDEKADAEQRPVNKALAREILEFDAENDADPE